MDYFFENREGISFPPIRPEFTEDETAFFGRFRVLKPSDREDGILGKGASGVLYLARDDVLLREVALKIPHDLAARDETVKEQAIAETRRSVRLTHPNIVRIYDFHEDDQRWGISMQYVRGQNLQQFRQEDRESWDEHLYLKPRALEEIKPWIAQLCQALAYAHESAGLVHRDLKPHNLMLERNQGSQGADRLILLDFGLSEKIAEVTARAAAEERPDAQGTVPYMSPQQLSGEEPSRQDDVYSIGATIYDLLTGAPPFFEGDDEAIRTQIAESTPPSMTERLAAFGLTPHEVSPDWKRWDSVVADCLQKDPSRRPGSVRELAARLDLDADATGPGPDPARLPVPAELQAVVDEQGAQLAALESSLEARDEELGTLREESGAAGELAGRREAELDDLRAEHEAANRQISSLEEDLREARGEVERLAKVLEDQGDTAGVLKELQGDLAKEKERRSDLMKQLDKASVALAKKDQRLQKAQERIEELSGGRDATGGTEEARGDLQARLDQITEELTRTAEERERLQTVLQSREEERERMGQEVRKATLQLKQSNESLNNAIARITDLERELDEELKAGAALKKELKVVEAELEKARGRAGGTTAESGTDEEQVSAEELAEAQRKHREADRALAEFQTRAARAEQLAREKSLEVAEIREEQRAAGAGAPSSPSAPRPWLLGVVAVVSILAGLLAGTLLKRGSPRPVGSVAFTTLQSEHEGEIPTTEGTAPQPVSFELYERYGVARGLPREFLRDRHQTEGAPEALRLTYLEAEGFCSWLTDLARSDPDRPLADSQFYRVASAREILSHAGRSVPEWSSDEPPGRTGVGFRLVVNPGDLSMEVDRFNHVTIGVRGDATLGFRITLSRLDR